MKPGTRLDLAEVLFPDGCAMYTADRREQPDWFIHVTADPAEKAHVTNQKLNKLPQKITYRRLQTLSRQLGLDVEVCVDEGR